MHNAAKSIYTTDETVT